MSLIGRLAGIADWALQTRELWLVLAALLALVWWRHRGFLTWLRNLVLSENLTLHPDDRILVFAPHCDDETLGAGGILHTAGRLGCARKVVLLTNGDGFRYGVSGRFHRLRPSPEEYIRYAYLRQEETIEALSHCNVAADDVIFFGYPDRGLGRMWTHHWRPDDPYTSNFTRADHSPYKNTYNPESLYCGQHLLADLETICAEFQPTIVIVPHSYDAHTDHWASHAFVVYALEKLASSRRLKAPPSIYSYLIHRGNWPRPKGRYTRLPLWPPRRMSEVVDNWLVHDLTEEATQAKLQGILAHRSQVAWMGRYLISFARTTELFMPVDPVTIKNITVTGQQHVLQQVPKEELTISLPTGDTLARRLQGRADIRGLMVYHDGQRLFLRLELRKAPSPYIQYVIHVNRISDRPYHFTLTLRTGRPGRLRDLESGTEDSVMAVQSKTGWTVRVPVSRLGSPDRLFVSAETRLGRMQIDSLGWTLLRVEMAS